MLLKNNLLITLLVIAIPGFVLPQNLRNLNEIRKWVISENSNLCVNGSTNINKFSCEIPSYGKTDTLTIGKNKNDKEIILTGDIGLSVQSFDCHNSMMTKDLRKTLKEKQFPILHITFLSLNKLPELSTRSEQVTGLVDITIAGIRKRFEVNYIITEDSQKVIRLLGARDINFSDFNLVPPRKLGGMIQTKDQLSVEFHMNIKTLN
jgi:hypothetical protein